MNAVSPTTPQAVPVQKYEIQLLMGRHVIGSGVISLYPQEILGGVNALKRCDSNHQSTDEKIPAERLQAVADEVAFCYELSMNSRNQLIRTHISAMLPEVPEDLQLETPAVIS